MSKGGGAGKVYFVLYLAVVLELLIIIVERDEAEEALRAKTKQAMKIVESILSQLQSGAGTEAINTRPQDEITIPKPGVNFEDILGVKNIKSYRQYIVEVGVTDVPGSMLKKEAGESDGDFSKKLKKLVELANVEQLQYQIFFSEDKTNTIGAPSFPSDSILKKNYPEFLDVPPGSSITGATDASEWKLLAVKEINLNKDATFNQIVDLSNIKYDQFNPVYPEDLKKSTGEAYIPSSNDVKIPADSMFCYSESESKKLNSGTGGLKKRSFMVYFQPPYKAGWYKLRFASRTNRILGVRGGLTLDEVQDDATVNIGTVSLTVNDLRKVKKELERKLEKFELPTLEELTTTYKEDIQGFRNKLEASKLLAASDENAKEFQGKIDLYGYIITLLAPGQSINFNQNRGSIEFNVHVLTPDPKRPPVLISNLPENFNSFDKVPAVFEFNISPYYPNQNFVTGRVLDASNAVVARIDMKPLDELLAGTGKVAPPTDGKERTYRATFDQALAPGKYKIEITHKLNTNETTNSTDIEIFKTGLATEFAKAVDTKFSTRGFFGSKLIFTVQSAAGNKIKANQFKIYLKSNANSQIAPVEGLSMNQENNFIFTPEMTDVSCKIVWIQPYTNAEVDIYPEKSFKIKQESPSILYSNMQVDYSGTSSKVKVKLSGITLSSVQASVDKNAIAKMFANGAISKTEGLTTYELSTEPLIEEVGESSYNIEFELTGKMEKGKNKITGVVEIPLKCIATNPINKAVSEAEPSSIPVNINWDPGSGNSKKSTGGAKPSRR
jgi:hypothetical protein